MEDLLPCCTQAGISVKYGRKVLQRLQAVAPARAALEAAVACGAAGSKGEMEGALASCKNVRCMLDEGLLAKADVLLQQLTVVEEEEQRRLAEARRQQEAAAAEAAAAQAAREREQQQKQQQLLLQQQQQQHRQAVVAAAGQTTALSVGIKSDMAVQAGRTHIPEVKSPRSPRALHHIHHHHHHHHHHEHLQQQ